MKCFNIFYNISKLVYLSPVYCIKKILQKHSITMCNQRYVNDSFRANSYAPSFIIIINHSIKQLTNESIEICKMILIYIRLFCLCICFGVGFSFSFFDHKSEKVINSITAILLNGNGLIEIIQ